MTNKQDEMMKLERSILKLRVDARLSRAQFAKEAGLAPDTVKKMELGTGGVTYINAQKAVDTLNKLLGTEYTVEDIQGLEVSRI